MRITFCGHSDYLEYEKYKNNLLQLFEELAIESDLEFYLGRDGRFDYFAYSCANQHKQNHPNTKIIFVTPYILPNYSKLVEADELFDDVIYPPLENAPYKFAIIKRNEWLINHCELIIAYVKHSFGGAAKTLAYAKRKRKNIINLIEQNV